jgi:hypothetical protein
MMNQVNILSFDVGIKNLAYCLFSYDLDEMINVNFTITEWDILNVGGEEKKPSIYTQSEIVFRTLHDKFGNRDIDYVVIENQPALKNPIMKTIQVMIYSYFKCSAYLYDKRIQDIKMVNATNKLKFAKLYLPPLVETTVPETNKPIPQKGNYKKNKMDAIAYTENLLLDNEMLVDLEYFKKYKKKDDLADTLLQGLYFCKECI